MKISTTITKKFFEMKMADLKEVGFFIEYKEDKPFWKKRLDNILKKIDRRVWGIMGELPEIIFLVGNKPYRFNVSHIFYEKNIPEKYKDAIKTKGAFALKCIPSQTEVKT